MVNLNAIQGSHVQEYYLSFTNGATGHCPVSGPFFWDFDRESRATESLIKKFDYGPPCQTEGEDLVDLLANKNVPLHGENPCKHTNVKGTVCVKNGAVVKNLYGFYPAMDELSVSNKAYWFFPSSSTTRQKAWSSGEKIGYGWGLTSIASASALSLYYGYDYYPADGRSVDTVSGSTKYHCTLPTGPTGTLDVTYKNSSRPVVHIKFVITNFRMPNLITVAYYYNDVLQSTTETTLRVIPVSPTGAVDTAINIQAITDLINQPLSYCQHVAVPKGTLVQGAVESIAYIDSNTLENAVGWKDVASILPPAKALLAPLKPKNLASLYLWYKYSFVPNMHDFPELVKGIKTAYSDGNDKKGYKTKYNTIWARQSCHYGQVETRSNCRVRLRNQSYTSLQSLYGDLRGLGLAPTADNLWDLIPFSFVIDWFLPVGKSLHNSVYAFDVLTNQYDIYDVILSNKSTLVVDMAQYSPYLAGILTYSRYDREVSQTLPTNDFSFGSQNPLRHLFEGIALVVANW